MATVDEHLRHRGATASPLDHLFALSPAIRDVMLDWRDTLVPEQPHGARAIGAEGFGIDFDVGHGLEVW